MSLLLKTINNDQKANKAGESLELIVETMLENKGYTKFKGDKSKFFNQRGDIDKKQYARRIKCGKSIYETSWWVDFLVINQNKYFIIEYKWQQSLGKYCDEKYPYLVANIKKLAIPTIILIDGGAYKKGAIKWLKNQVHPNRSLIGVYSIAEFQKLVNKNYLDYKSPWFMN